MKVVISPEAGSDLLEIGRYIANDNPPAAIEFVEKLVESCQSLSQHPNRFRVVRERQKRKIRLMPFRDYVVLYETNKFNLNVLRIFHSSRDFVRVLDEVN